MLKIKILRFDDLFENENQVYFQQEGAPFNFHANKFYRSHIQSEVDRTKKMCYGVTVSISDLSQPDF